MLSFLYREFAFYGTYGLNVQEKLFLNRCREFRGKNIRDSFFFFFNENLFHGCLVYVSRPTRFESEFFSQVPSKIVGVDRGFKIFPYFQEATALYMLCSYICILRWGFDIGTLVLKVNISSKKPEMVIYFRMDKEEKEAFGFGTPCLLGLKQKKLMWFRFVLFSNGAGREVLK